MDEQKPSDSHPQPKDRPIYDSNQIYPQPTALPPISFNGQQTSQNTKPPKRRLSKTISSLITLISLCVFTGSYIVWSEQTSDKQSVSNTISSSTNNLMTYTVPGELVNGSPGFTTSFYKDAGVQSKSGLVYLISQSADGTQSSIWIYKLKTEVPTCESGGTSFRVTIMSQSVPGCFRNDRIIYTAEITRGGIKYQVNLVSQTPIEINEAKGILSSVTFD